MLPASMVLLAGPRSMGGVTAKLPMFHSSRRPSTLGGATLGYATAARRCAAADDAVDRAEVGLTQLLNAAINQHLLAYDAVGAARQITKRLTLETTDPAGLFDALRREQEIWYERGRDRGLRLDLEIAISLARTSHEWASEADQRGMSR